MVDFDDVEAAAERLRGVAVHTPVLTSPGIDQAVRAEVFFKAENLQRAGAFKFRGAFNALSRLDAAARQRGVVAFTSGNHGLAVSQAAKRLGTHATIVMPHDAPRLKVEGARSAGATLVFYDRRLDDRAAIAQRFVERDGMALIPPFDHDDVIAGQGTAALELLREVPRLDTLLVCVGGGGFFAGSTVAARALQPAIRMVGAEPEAGNDAEQSMRAGRIVTLAAVPDTLCDGQQTLALGTRPFAVLMQHRCEVLSASDASVLRAMACAFEQLKLVLEPSGACALAVLMQHAASFAGQRVGVMLSGGNIDRTRFAQLITQAVEPAASPVASSLA